MKNIFFMMVVLHCTSILHGQSLQGTIYDQTSGEPLPGVNIIITDLKQVTVSDTKGHYRFSELPKGRFLTNVRLLGYSSQSKMIDFPSEANVDFRLEPSIIEKNEVVVTGSAFTGENARMSTSVTPLDRLQITSLAPGNLTEAIATLPGVAAITTGNAIAKPVIRGLSYNRVVVINQGIRQEGQQWGDEHGLEIDQFSADHIEVLKGPASLQYGSDALGGVINILEPIPAATGTIRGLFNSQYSFNNRLTGNSLLLEGNQSGFVWRARGSYKNAASFRTPVETVYNSGFSEQAQEGLVGFNKKWGYSHMHFSRWSSIIGLTEGERDSTTGQFVDSNGNIVTEDQLNTRKLVLPEQHIEHLKISTANNFLLKGRQLRFNAGWQQNNRKEFEETYIEPGISMRLNTFSYDLKYLPIVRDHREDAIGLSGTSQTNENLGLEYLIPEYQSMDAGVFATTKYNFEKSTFNFGIRYDQRSLTIVGLQKNGVILFQNTARKFRALTGSAGFTYAFTEDVSIKTNMGRAFRSPAIPELSANGVHEGTFRYEIGSLDLNPETAHELDAGLIFNRKLISFTTDLFYNYIANYIYYEQTNNETKEVDGVWYPVYRYTQSDALLWGGEFTLDIHLIDDLHFENSASLVYANNRELDRPLPFIPPVKTFHELRYDASGHSSKHLRGVYFKVSIENIFAQDRIDQFESITAGYVLMNAGFGGTILLQGLPLNFFVNGSNLTNKTYFNHLNRYKDIGVNGTGRNISLGIELPLSMKGNNR